MRHLVIKLTLTHDDDEHLPAMAALDEALNRYVLGEGECYSIVSDSAAAGAHTSLAARRTSRPGGRQVSLERGVRALSWALLDEGFVGTERQAQRLARKWLTRALPAKQKRPRQQPADLSEAA